MKHRILAVLLPMLAAACSQEPEAEQMPATVPVEVRVVPVRRGAIAATVQLAGETAALDVLRLGSPIAGRVTAVDVRPGDSLAKGQVAARVLPLESEAAVNGFAILEKSGALRGDGERRDAKRLSSDLRRRDIALSAPFAAVVAERLRNPGELVAANDIVLELFNPNSLYVLAQASLDVSSSLHAGMPAQISLGDWVVSGQVEAILTAVMPQALTLPVRIALTSPLPRPLLHAAVQCRILTARHDDALLIPPTAILPVANGDGAVMVAEGDHATRRSVRVGLKTPEAIEVLDGLAEGEIVLVDGHYALPDGAPITTRVM